MPHEVAYIAFRFFLRDLAHEVTGQPMYLDDLEAWLAYRGWDKLNGPGDGRSWRAIYIEAVGAGRILKLGGHGEYGELLPPRQQGKMMEVNNG